MSINFELRDLRAFLAVFDTANFHKAAELMNMSQPALSRRIQALEHRLGGPLLERTTRQVKPTIAGRNIEPIARRLLDEIDHSLPSVDDLSEQRGGQVSIASIPSFAVHYLPPVIKKFKARFPLVRIRVLDRSTQEALNSVTQAEVEFGINVVGATEADISFTPLMDDPYVLACLSRHPLARKRSVTWRELVGFPLIRIGRSDSSNRAVLDTALARKNVRLDWMYEVNNLTTALGWVECGLGVSVLPGLAIPKGGHRSVVRRPILRPEVTRTVGIVERRKGRLSPAASILRDMLIEEWSSGKS